MRSLIFSAASLLPYLGFTDAFWRMNCAVVQTGRVDPLVNPGALAAHAHTIVGGSNIGVNSSMLTGPTPGEIMLNSSCTSCEITADKSAYWTPLLYYWYPNGSFYEVPHAGSVVYYLGRGPNVASIVPFPPGFQILSGNKALRSYDNQTMTYGNATYPGRPIAERVSFACLPLSGPQQPNRPYMFPASQCGNGLRAQIAFQGCWNGVDLYKSDNSHVAYLSNIDNGICPPGYQTQIPLIFVETLYSVSQVPDAHDDSRFVFSQGDPTGYGFHGDFINGWDVDVQREAVNTCLYNGAPDGVIQQCDVLNRHDTNGYPHNCPEQPPQIGERVKGMLDHLPGCVQVTYGPDSATSAQMECAPTVPRPSITPTPFGTPLPTASPVPGQMFGLPQHKYLGCYNDTIGLGGGYRALNSIQRTNYSVMTVEYCQQYCINAGYRYSGVEYAQECHCDNELNPTAIMAPNGSVNQCTWNCGGTMTKGGTQEFCGGLSNIDIYMNTNSTFDAFGDNTNSAGQAEPWTPPGGFGPEYIGCYSDNTGGRTLTGPNVSWRNMTVEICAAYCAAGPGYQYYGLEFATQCYCGNSIADAGRLLTPTTTPTNDTCKARCQGSEPEICGGSSVLSMYNSSAFVAPQVPPHIGQYQTTAQNCLTDPNLHGRALQGNRTILPEVMTVDICIKFCLGSYYHYAGVEYGNECYCGNEIVTATTGAHLAICNITDQMLCDGSQYEYCGGRGFMNLYYSEAL